MKKKKVEEKKPEQVAKDQLTYKIKPVNLTFKPGEDIALNFPALKERVIEKRGHVITFTLAQVEANTLKLAQTRKEIQAKRDYEDAIAKNIDHFHPNITAMSDEDLLTAWMYKEAKGNVDLCDKKLKEIDDQMESDKVEIAEIYKQIPELNGDQK
jgi:hypothetical protein